MQEEQNHINLDAPGSDMLGNIDGYVIGNCYDIKSTSGKRVTDILSEYYNGGAAKSNQANVVFRYSVNLLDLENLTDKIFLMKLNG